MPFSLYYRSGNRRTQTDEDARAITASGVLRGYAPRGSDIPTVQAWAGAIPLGQYGLEFRTRIPPDPYSAPGQPLWRAGSPGVTLGEDERGDYAEIPITVTRVVLSTEVGP